MKQLLNINYPTKSILHVGMLTKLENVCLFCQSQHTQRVSETGEQQVLQLQCES